MILRDDEIKGIEADNIVINDEGVHILPVYRAIAQEQAKRTHKQDVEWLESKMSIYYNNWEHTYFCFDPHTWQEFKKEVERG